MCLEVWTSEILKWVNFFCWKRRSWALVDARNLFFCEWWFRAHTGSFGDLPKSTNLENIKVDQIFLFTKSGSWVLVGACKFFFGGGSLIRACTGSFENVFRGVNLGNIIFVLSKSGSWALVDVHNLLMDSKFLLSAPSSSESPLLAMQSPVMTSLELWNKPCLQSYF